MSSFSRENQTLGVDKNATLVACSSISFVSTAIVLGAYQYWLSSHFSSLRAKNLFRGFFFRDGGEDLSSSFTGSIDGEEALSFNLSFFSFAECSTNNRR